MARQYYRDSKGRFISNPNKEPKRQEYKSPYKQTPLRNKRGQFIRLNVTEYNIHWTDADLVNIIQEYGGYANTRIKDLERFVKAEGGSSYALRYRVFKDIDDQRRPIGDEYLHYFETDFKDIEAMTSNQKRMEVREILQFLNAKTSTIAGEMSYRRSNDEFIRSIGLNPDDYGREEKSEFFKGYRELIESHEVGTLYSGRGRGDDKVVLRAYTDLYKRGLVDRTDLKSLAKRVNSLVMAKKAESTGNYAAADDFRAMAYE